MSAAAFIQAPKWRWPVALAAVIALHGAALLVLRDVRPVSAPDVPQDAVMLDLTPPAAPAPATEPAPPPPTPAPAPPPAVPETAMAPPPAAVPEKAEVVLPPPPPLPLPRAAPAPERPLP
jgi:protein TonB